MTNHVMNEHQKFEYTYSAKQQKEIDHIRKKYLPQKEDKMETLRKLDRGTERPGTIIALMLGVFGMLLLGIGMSCTMVWKGSVFVLGIVIGILGIVVASIAYPVYKKITAKQRMKVAEKILALSEELSS